MRISCFSVIIGCAVVLCAQTGVATAQSAPQVGDQVRVKTASAVVEGVLVDKLQHAYLVRTSERTLVIPYEQVESIEVVAAEPEEETTAATPAPIPDEVVPLASALAPGIVARAARKKWPMTFTVQYVFGLQPHALSMGISGSGQTASFRPPESDITILPATTVDLKPWLGLGVDFLMNLTSAMQVAPGTEGCINTGCYPFPNGASHNTFTLMPTLWGKYLHQFGDGRARAWGGAGVNLAWVYYNYDHYGAGSDVGVSLALGAGGDYRIPLGRYQLVFSTSLALGSPVYDEDIDDFVFEGNSYSKGDVGHAVPAWRFGLGLGVGFPVRPPASPK